jgi:hypothetical protein
MAIDGGTARDSLDHANACIFELMDFVGII